MKFQVCLLPYILNKTTKIINPLKIYACYLTPLSFLTAFNLKSFSSTLYRGEQIIVQKANYNTIKSQYQHDFQQTINSIISSLCSSSLNLKWQSYCTFSYETTLSRNMELWSLLYKMYRSVIMLPTFDSCGFISFLCLCKPYWAVLVKLCCSLC